MPLLTLPRTPTAHRARAFVFEDPASRRLLRTLDDLASSEATVLITGETGTGKEIVARYLHEHGARRAGPFVAVNCGAISESLVDSELFGHERGAFTGAATARAGWFEAADGGTLFLDELAELPAATQVKLLRALQEREVVRIGARQPTAIDVRVIAATNVQLEREVARGRFRADLYYRIHVVSIDLPPLRDRRGDILPLAHHFSQRFAERGRPAPAILPAAAERLRDHAWPGNIRELENVLQRAVLASRGAPIGPEHVQLGNPPGAAAPALPADPAAPSGTPRGSGPAACAASRAAEAAGAPSAACDRDALDGLASALGALLEHPPANLYARVEALLLCTAYQRCGGNQLQTARVLGISRNVVRARLIQFGALAGALRGGDPDRVRPRAIRVGYHKFGLLGLVKARGAFDRAMRDRGRRVEWTEFPSGTQLVDALRAGSLDLGGVGEGPPVLAQAAGAPIVYLAAEPPAPHDEAIVVHADSPCRTVADLRGKTIALAPGACVSYLVLRALDEAELAYDDVAIAALPPAEARAAFEARQVDAWAIWNPLLSWIAETAGARVLRDATGLAANTAYYVGARDFADGDPELVAAFLDEVRATGRWANGNPERVIELMAHALAMPRSPIAAALSGARFGAEPCHPRTLLAQQQVADAFHRVQLIAHPVRVADAAWLAPADARRATE